MRLDALTNLFPEVAEVEITTWVAKGWVAPDQDEGGDWVFAQIDVARVRLIRDLRYDMGVADDVVPLILSLLDQIYELRSALKVLSRAIENQSELVRASVRADLQRTAEEPLP